MKTIKQIADSLGTTRQTLYNIVKRKGLSFDELTTEIQGKTRLFDEEAEARIREIFDNKEDNTCQNNNVVNDNTTTEADCKRVEELSKSVEELTKELEEARQKVERQEEEISRLNKLVEVQLGTIASLSETVRMKEAKEHTLLLESPHEEKQGFFKRMAARLRGK